MRSIRIAFVASTFGVGGAERVMCDVISRLSAQRFEPYLYFLRDAGTVGRELIATGVGALERLERFRGDPLTVAAASPAAFAVAPPMWCSAWTTTMPCWRAVSPD